MPIQPNEPSCQAISIQVSIISANDGSTPPAAHRVERGHQPAGPHLVDDRRRERAQPLGFGGLGAHQVAHPARQSTTRSAASAIDVIVAFPITDHSVRAPAPIESLDPKACRTTLLGVRHRPSPVHRRAAPLGDRTHQRLNQPLPPPQPAPRSHPHRPPRLPHPQPDPPTTPPTRPIQVVRHALAARPLSRAGSP